MNREDLVAKKIRKSIHRHVSSFDANVGQRNRSKFSNIKISPLQTGDSHQNKSQNVSFNDEYVELIFSGWFGLFKSK